MSEKSALQSLMKKGIWMYIFSFIIAPIGYVSKILISGEVSVSELGILYGVISLITLLSAFSDFGISESLKYFIPQYQQKKEYRKIKSILLYGGVIQIFSGVLLAGFFFFGAEFIANSYFQSPQAKEILQVFALFFLGINIFQIITNFFLALENTIYFKLCEFVRNICILLSIIALLYFGSSSLIHFSYAWIVGLYSGIVLAVILFLTGYKSYYKSVDIIWSKRLLKKFFSYAGIVFLSAQIGVLLSQVDMQMIIFLLGVESAGYYSVYLSLIMIPFMIITPLFGLLLPTFSRLGSLKKEESIRILKKQLGEIFIVIGLLFSIFFYIFASDIAFIFFGENYLLSGDILRYSCLFIVFNLLLQINFNILGGIGKVQYKFYITLIALIGNTTLNIIFINIFGVGGAALATALGWIAIWVMSEYVLRKKYSSGLNMIFLGKNILYFFCISLVTLLAKNYFEDISHPRIIVLFSLSVIFFLWSIGFIYINKSFLNHIRKTLK